MRKLIGILLLAGVVALIYITFSDPKRKAQILSILENSAGLDLKSPSSKSSDAGKPSEILSIPDSLKQFGDTLNDPQLQNSLKEWGDKASENLNRIDLEKLQRDLKKESQKMEKNFDAVLKEYLKSSDNP